MKIYTSKTEVMKTVLKIAKKKSKRLYLPRIKSTSHHSLIRRIWQNGYATICTVFVAQVYATVVDMGSNPIIRLRDQCDFLPFFRDDLQCTRTSSDYSNRHSILSNSPLSNQLTKVLTKYTLRTFHTGEYGAMVRYH
ncbi:hypothetical protein BDQ12DRAFT_318455 [Crucibulum laeve]|uniref:Uncharacterized protein n=1 Tax=Crucibulum laeve TaxID=68775 RepID=A0A5C3LRT6_9AGAR|nr:hypothetical protein BDQ12DRAFT_318455 [Crucibulum laeve]